jgi:hypothetical protein
MADDLKLSDASERSGLLLGVEDLDDQRSPMKAGDSDGTDGDKGSDSDGSDGDASDSDGSDGGDSDGSDGSDGDGSDSKQDGGAGGLLDNKD